MEALLLSTAGAFRDRVWTLLTAHEAENNLMLGVLGRILAGQSADDAFYAVVEERGEVAGAAMCTPPYRLQLSRMPEEAARTLALRLAGAGYVLPGVLGPRETTEPFARAWTALTGVSSSLTKPMRVYQLDRVDPPAPVAGRMERAGAPDIDLVARWMSEMASETHLMLAPSARARAEQSLQRGEAYLWQNDAPVAMACVSAGTPNGARIGMVYTPPDLRRRGYATALVAALSSHVLDSGKRFCFLFTDLDNPTSNSIYMKIGYRPVCDFTEWDFTQ